MPSGIIMQSSSAGGDEANQAGIEKVLEANGYEVDKPAPEAPAEPKREDFTTDEEFEAAQDKFEAEAEEREAAEEAAREAEEDEKEKAREKNRERHDRQQSPTRRQKAIAKATKDLQDQLKQANERIAALEGKKPASETHQVEAPTAPKREDFKSDGEFEDAMFDYRYKLRRAKEQAEEHKNQLDAKLQTNFENYKAGVAAFKEEHDDFDEVVNQSLNIPQSVYFAIVDLEKDGARVSYYLGQHPEIIEQLWEKTPYAAAIEVGRIADKLKAGKLNGKANDNGGERPKPRPRVQAPEPVRPLSTSATASTLTSREAAKNRDFKAFKQAQRRGA